MVVLYRDFLKIDLRRQDLGVSGFKDAVLQGQKLKELYGDLFQKLRTELRVRHYSLRTEHAYESWVRRFLSFHEGEPMVTSQKVRVKIKKLVDKLNLRCYEHNV